MRGPAQARALARLQPARGRPTRKPGAWKPWRSRAPPTSRGSTATSRASPSSEVQRELGLRRVVKLASNENPLGPSPRALEALAQAPCPGVHRYPDGPGERAAPGPRRTLRRARSAQVVVGNGSTDLIDLLARAFLGPGDNAVISEHAFVRFRQCVAARNGGARLVPMRDWTHDLEAMAAAIDARTRLVFVANPNNPTGTWNRRARGRGARSTLPARRCLLVLDEAYFEYADDPDYPNGLDYVRAGPPSSSCGPSRRSTASPGCAWATPWPRPEVLEPSTRVREPFNTNSVAQAAAARGARRTTEHVRSR